MAAQVLRFMGCDVAALNTVHFSMCLLEASDFFQYRRKVPHFPF
jgi:pyridoxal/pyridoxine/pyridoxamine kinase